METPEQDAVREPAHPPRDPDGTVPESRWIPMIPSDWDMEEWQAYLAEKGYTPPPEVVLPPSIVDMTREEAAPIIEAMFAWFGHARLRAAELEAATGKPVSLGYTRREGGVLRTLVDGDGVEYGLTRTGELARLASVSGDEGTS